MATIPVQSAKPGDRPRPKSLRPRIKRQDLPAGACLCDHCTARCCRYFAMPMEKPKNKSDFDFCRWYLLHDAATIFTEDGTWYLCVHTDCKHILPDNRCGIYETRPQICRDYSTDDCEYEDGWCYERYFETPEQIWEYAEALFGTGTDSLRSPEPQGLPILG